MTATRRSGLCGTIMSVLLQFYSCSDSRMVDHGRDIIGQLDKLYYYYYPYPPKRFTQETITSKIRRFHLRYPIQIRDLIRDSALANLMPLKEFIVKILINHLGRILEKDPFLFLKFQEAFNANPHAFRRIEIKTEPNPYNDKIIRNPLKNHAKSGYNVLVTEEEMMAKVKASKNCRYCGCLLRYYRLKGIPRDFWAEVDRRDRNQTTLTNENVQIICHACNFMKLNKGHDFFIKNCRLISERNKDLD